MRKLASIQRIQVIKEIPKADNIVCAVILGWEVVIRRGEFKVGDMVVYVEVDSILPPRPEFEFLRERKFRIRTIKLKGQVSQGICFPLSILRNTDGYREGSDVTEKLGVRKYDPQAEAERKETERLASIDKNRLTKFLKRYSWFRRLIYKPTKTPFPAFIRKTDEDRIQLFPDYYEKWGHLTFDMTEKVDGQSATYFCIPNPRKGLLRKKWLFGVCSRNYQLLKPDNSSYWELAKVLNLQEKMKWWCNLYKKGLIIQGEATGIGIQGNKYNLNDRKLFVFNVSSYFKGKTTVFNQGEQVAFCANLDINTVEWLSHNTTLMHPIPEMVELAKGKSVLNPNIPREGIVVRNYEHNISFKVINPDFLLKYEE